MTVGVRVKVAVAKGVAVAVLTRVAVAVAKGVAVAVLTRVAVANGVGVRVGVRVAVAVPRAVAVAVCACAPFTSTGDASVSKVAIHRTRTREIRDLKIHVERAASPQP